MGTGRCRALDGGEFPAACWGHENSSSARPAPPSPKFNIALEPGGREVKEPRNGHGPPPPFPTSTTGGHQAGSLQQLSNSTLRFRNGVTFPSLLLHKHTAHTVYCTRMVVCAQLTLPYQWILAIFDLHLSEATRAGHFNTHWIFPVICHNLHITYRPEAQVL